MQEPSARRCVHERLRKLQHQDLGALCPGECKGALVK